MSLFSTYQLNNKSLRNHMVMAPMTRCRTSQPGDIANDLMATYYAQRATAGLIITEATQISPQSQGYSFTPGIFTKKQIEGWKKVTSAIHDKGGVVFNQLWHVGRVSHPIFQQGKAPVGPSALPPIETQIWVADDGGTMLDCPTPRALSVEEIKVIVADFAQAAKNAVEAGFDGVEIHGGNGYLIDQFLRTNSNIRTDQYGGNKENRLRFLMEVISACVEAIGADKVGVRLAPYVTFKDMNCPEIVETILLASKKLQALNIAYLHLSEADWDDAPEIPLSFRKELRQYFTNTVIVAGRYDRQRAEKILLEGLADLVAFGRDFIANPDLPTRLKKGQKFSELDGNTLFGGNEKGYSDYPNYFE
ncbi:alkene reductase [Psychromonas hadalis]|uniref:alkene reductase n=1 Tax=Psychromonas hadalis TaxID=211669 RepID=UPI0003B62A09|nr:alkene reductase [Psychromonas hadalis]